MVENSDTIYKFVYYLSTGRITLSRHPDHVRNFALGPVESLLPKVAYNLRYAMQSKFTNSYTSLNFQILGTR
jgi:hypothetical protein